MCGSWATRSRRQDRSSSGRLQAVTRFRQQEFDLEGGGSAISVVRSGVGAALSGRWSDGFTSLLAHSLYSLFLHFLSLSLRVSESKKAFEGELDV